MNEEEQARKEIEETIAQFNKTTKALTNTTYTAIGHGITTWSRMEGMLVHIASWLLGSHSEQVGMIFYSINNFHTWLSIIDELFEMDPNFRPLRPDWIKIRGKLTKLNDVRVRLAHHAVEKGKDLLEIAENGSDIAEAFPGLKPSDSDTRAKWKKKTAIDLSDIVKFTEQLVDEIEKITELMTRMGPIYLGPKQRLVAKIKELQQKAH